MDVKKSQAELTEFETYVLRDKGTERPFTGKYTDYFEMESTTTATVAPSSIILNPNFTLVVGGPRLMMKSKTL